MILDPAVLANTVAFEDAGDVLGADLRRALETALGGAAAHPAGSEPLAVFRAGLAYSLGKIASDSRTPLFLRFLSDGPYDRPGRFLRKYAGTCLRDQDTMRVLRFICGHMISSFQGFLAEVLAAGALANWLVEERRAGRLPNQARLYLGDSVMGWQTTTRRRARAADAYVLAMDHTSGRVVVHAAAEVKSYSPARDAVRKQLSAHLARARRGLLVSGERVAARRVKVPHDASRLLVTPSSWRLPRTFRYEQTSAGHQLHFDVSGLPTPNDEVVRRGTCDVRILLRWSREALASVAYDMSHWYMGRVGEAVWAKSAPPWLQMTPNDAGRNAAKQMLYFALLRVRTAHDLDKAIALYNAYGFGYALGMNFRDRRGVRQMMWPSDVAQVAARGETDSGCRIW